MAERPCPSAKGNSSASSDKAGFSGLPPRKQGKQLSCFPFRWIHQNGRQPLFLFPVLCSLAMYTLSCNRQRVTVHPSSRLSRIRSGEQCSPVQRFLCVDERQPSGFIQLQPSSLSSWPSKLSPSGSMRSKRMPWATSSLASFHNSRSSSMVNVAEPSVYSTSVAVRFPSSS